MQGPFGRSEPVASKREFALFLVDASDHSTPETGEGGGQPQIRKPGATSWTNTEATMIHIGNGHYVLVLTASELDTLGTFSIRYKSGNTDEFQDTGVVVASSGEISLDEVNAKIDKNRSILKRIQWQTNTIKKRTEPDPFINPL